MRRIIFTISIVMMGLLALVPAPALAFNPFGSVCNNGGGSSAICQEQSKGTTNPLTGTNGLFFGISRIIAIIAGVAAVIIIVIAGLRFVTSGGDPQKTKAAKDAIVAALIGLVIIVLAGSIISLVLSRI